MKIFLSILLILTVFSCAQPPIDKPKKGAQYVGVADDPGLNAIVSEFKKLAKSRNIKFKNEVSIGFTDIKRKSVIGLCTYGFGFREIDLDSKFWKNSSWMVKIALGYHELIHCYCQRAHDYGYKKFYPTDIDELTKFLDELTRMSPIKIDGYMEDGCPSSIMHPIVLDGKCIEKHYSQYVNEMFERCYPY